MPNGVGGYPGFGLGFGPWSWWIIIIILLFCCCGGWHGYGPDY